MKKLLCWLGIHRWNYYHWSQGAVRLCLWCYKRQVWVDAECAEGFAGYEAGAWVTKKDPEVTDKA